jgi:hypothetical protein
MLKLKNTDWKVFGIGLHSADDDDNGGKFFIQIYKTILTVDLPDWFIPPHKICRYNSYSKSFYDDIVVRSYSIRYILSEHYISIDYGIQDERGDLSNKSTYKNALFDIPWMHHKYSSKEILNLDGSLFIKLPHMYADEDDVMLNYPRLRYKIEDFDGVVLGASVYLTRTTFDRGVGWFSWLKYITKPMVVYALNIEYDDEFGVRKDSWKGGTLSCYSPTELKRIGIENMIEYYREDYPDARIIAYTP